MEEDYFVKYSDIIVEVIRCCYLVNLVFVGFVEIKQFNIIYNYWVNI